MAHHIRLRHVPGRYGIARLAADAPMPGWAEGHGLMAMIRADDEMTVVCASERIPPDVQTDGPWACLRSIGPFAFQATGIVQALVSPLSAAGIGVFVLCTFDGEHLMVAEADLDRAMAALREAGHEIMP